MKKQTIIVLVLLLALTSATFAGRGDSKSWAEDMTVDPDYSATGDWIVTNRSGSTNPLPVSGGVMPFNGFNLFDDRYNHHMNGDTNFEIGFGPTPADGPVAKVAFHR